MPECEGAVCDEYARYLVHLDGMEYRRYCGQCVDDLRDHYAGDFECVRQL
jgi:hypothetical protein